MEPPPGGPPDAAPPQLVKTFPDSFQVFQDFDSDVDFIFDEVISEGGSPSQGTGTGDLERLVILSPTREVPKVRWRRDRITVRPDEGWQRDRVYRVELLPGVTDLRRNRLDSGAVVTFSTGAPVPRTRFQGVVVDWTSARPAPGALVVAMKLPDSLSYRGLADSSGRFNLGPLPAGQYVVSGVLDENRNHLADPREAFDSVRVARGDTHARALGLRPRHQPAASPHRHAAGQCLGERGAHSAAGPPAATPAIGRAAVAAAGLHPGKGRIHPAEAAGRQPPRASALGARHDGAGHHRRARHDGATGAGTRPAPARGAPLRRWSS